MKKFIVALMAFFSLCGLTACENFKVVGNRMETGTFTYYYALVHSQITGDKYYHISGWAEYGPQGGTYTDAYVGLELHLAVSKDVVYYYEPNLSYVLSKNYNADFGVAID